MIFRAAALLALANNAIETSSQSIGQVPSHLQWRRERVQEQHRRHLGGEPRTLQFSCDGSHAGGAGSKGSKRSKTTAKKGKVGKGSNCDAIDIACGDTFDGPVTMQSDLSCDGRDGVAITMNGPDSVLDCNGFSLQRSVNGDDRAVAIRLLGGATARNCVVIGFGRGVVMQDGDNTLVNSEIYKSYQGESGGGVVTAGFGCMTIENVISSSGEDDGFVFRSEGEIVIRNSAALFNEDRGLDINNFDRIGGFTTTATSTTSFTTTSVTTTSTTPSRALTVYIENIYLFANEDNAMRVNRDDVTVELYGTNIFHLAEDDGGDDQEGIEFDSQDGLLAIFGTVDIFLNGGTGLNMINGDLELAHGSVVKACLNNVDRASDDGLDIKLDTAGQLITNKGFVICNEVNQAADNADIVCHPGCEPINEGIACEEW